MSQPSSIPTPTPLDPVAESRRLFHRVLAAWAIDLFALRAAGLDTPGPRQGRQDRAIAPSLQDWASRRAA